MKILRSFEQGVNLGNFETARFSAVREMEGEWTPEEAKNVSDKLFQDCFLDVSQQITKFVDEISKKGMIWRTLKCDKCEKGFGKGQLRIVADDRNYHTDCLPEKYKINQPF